METFLTILVIAIIYYDAISPEDPDFLPNKHWEDL